jgi:hypothetical protein
VNSCVDLRPHPSTVQVKVIESRGSIFPRACLPATTVSSVVFSSPPRFSVLDEEESGGGGEKDGGEEAVE